MSAALSWTMSAEPSLSEISLIHSLGTTPGGTSSSFPPGMLPMGSLGLVHVLTESPSPSYVYLNPGNGDFSAVAPTAIGTGGTGSATAERSTQPTFRARARLPRMFAVAARRWRWRSSCRASPSRWAQTRCCRWSSLSACASRRRARCASSRCSCSSTRGAAAAAARAGCTTRRTVRSRHAIPTDAVLAAPDRTACA